MTERTFVSQSPGPSVLGLSLPAGSVRVQVVENLTTARVVLHTDDCTGPAADAVSRARNEQNGQAFAVEVIKLPDSVVMQSRRGNHVVQSVGTVTGSVIGSVIINGRVVSGGTATAPAVSPIEASVYLPVRSSLAIVSTSADTEVFGRVERMEFRSVSGDLDADIVGELTATTTSGDLRIGRAAGPLTATTVSGDILVDLYTGHDGAVSTTSGRIEMQATHAASGRLSARSVSGDIHLAGTHHLNVSTSSVSGRIRH